MVGWTGKKQKDGWIDINMDGWMERKKNRRMDVKIDGWLDGWTGKNKMMVGWMDIKMDGWIEKTQMDNKQMDGWMDIKKYIKKQMVG